LFPNVPPSLAISRKHEEENLLVLTWEFFFEMRSLALASASIDAHNSFIA
jgi:hypothetical protein